MLFSGAGRAVEALALSREITAAGPRDGLARSIPRYGALVMLLAEQGTADALREADAISAELVQIAEETHDPDQSSYWSALELRGLALAAAVRCAESVPLYTRAIQGIEQDPSETFTADWVRGLRADCHRALGRPAAAERDLRDAVAEVLAANGPDSEWNAEPLLKLAGYLNATGRAGEAGKLAAQALALWPGDVGVRAARGHYELGRALAGSDPARSRAEVEQAKRALGEGLDQCRLGDDIVRALGGTPRRRAPASR